MPVDKKSRGGGRRYSGLGFEFAAAVAGFALVGYWLGGYFGNVRLGLAIGAGLGVVGGMYNLIRAALARSGGKDPGSGNGMTG